MTWRRAILVSLSISLIVFVSSCGPEIVGSSMTLAESQALKNSFDRLDAALVSQALEIHQELAPPATDAEIQKLRRALNGKRVESLEAWYRWHNGTIDHTFLLPLGRPLSIAEALDHRSEIQTVPFVDDLRTSAIKLMDDGAGDGYFLDVTSPTPQVFYHMLEDPFPRYYGTMENFINYVARDYEDGIVFVNDSGQLDYDDSEFAVKEEAHLAKFN